MPLLISYGVCTTKEADGDYNGICYHVPIDSNNPQNSTTRSRILWIAAVILLLVVIAVLIIYKHSLPNDPSGNPGNDPSISTESESSSETDTETAALDITIDEQISFDLGDNLEITDLGRYSGKALTGDIFVYYKNCSDDLYYGGITYRARIEGGLGVNEIRQVVSSHYSANGSEILFVTCSE